MNVILKSKLNKKGDLCICLIDHRFPQNDEQLYLHKNDVMPAIKLKYFYKISNLGIESKKINEVSIKHKSKINEQLDRIRYELIKNELTIVEEKSHIVYVRDLRQTERKSCKIFDCFSSQTIN